MKRMLCFAALVLSAGVLAGTAAAGNGNANKSPNGAQTGHFDVTYTNVIGGTFDCHGQRVAKSGANGFVKDEEECTVSDAASFFPAGTDVGNPYYLFNGVYYWWNSDFDGQMAQSITYIVSPAQPDGSAHVKIIAFY